MRKHCVSCAVYTIRVNTMIRIFVAVSILVCACAQSDAAVDVTYPGGSVQVNKDVSAGAIAPVVPPEALDASGPPPPAALAPGTYLTRADRRRLRKEMRHKASGNVDVSYPFGGVSVRRAGEGGSKNVNVVYPGGSVNVGGNGQEGPPGSKPAVNVEYPGGSVRLQPKQPGERRKGVIEFPFGRVVLS